VEATTIPATLLPYKLQTNCRYEISKYRLCPDGHSLRRNMDITGLVVFSHRIEIVPICAGLQEQLAGRENEAIVVGESVSQQAMRG
jgi:hypothetical protein